MMPLRPVHLLAPAVALLAACRWGSGVDRFPPATQPIGATVIVDLREERRWSAELLAAEDSGLVVAVGTSRLRFVPYAALREGRVDGLGSDYAFGRSGPPEGETLARLRQVSRFPQGVDAALLARLLATYRVERVEVAR